MIDPKLAIKDFTPRLYQQTILATAAQKNTLVVLPTGLGKTNIFVMLAIQRLLLYPKSKVLLLGPTRPLIDQYKAVFEKYTNIPQEKMVVFTGMIRPEKRHLMWKEARIIFSTPQGLENDIIGGKISLKDVSLLGFDEAHRATGEYSYVWIAKQYENTAEFPRIIGMTASPGSDLETVQEVCTNLHVEDIESRTDADADVKPYIQDVKVTWLPVSLTPDMKRIKSFLTLCLNKRVERLKLSGAVNNKFRFVSRRDMIQLQGQLQARIAQGETEPEIWQGISIVAEVMKVQHALELIESQGNRPLLQYLERLETESYTTKVKAVKNLVIDSEFRNALALARIMNEKNVKHPKLIELIDLMKNKVSGKEYKAIIFTQYRDSGSSVVDELTAVGINAHLFVGQMKKRNTGLSQKNQKKVIEDFKNNEFQVLVSTSVGEEGLDIPAVDMVVFYEPVPSAIRTVQRRGRTGRQSKGEVVVLYTKNTRDEAYRWSAYHKEKRMGTHLKSLKQTLARTSTLKEPPLTRFVDKPVVYIDYREKTNQTVKRLVDIGVDVKLKTLNVGDYILSERCAVEFKTVEDFVASILDGRLLMQIQDLKKNYQRPMIIVEGSHDLFSVRNIHPNAIRGMLATITVSYGIPLLQTKDARESAAFMASVAKREQEKLGRDFSPHSEKKSLSIKQQQEYIVSALPGIGTTIAKPLLEHFGSVEKVMTASEKELKEVELVGKTKAKRIRDLLEKQYYVDN